MPRSFFGGQIQKYPVIGGSAGPGMLPDSLVSQTFQEDQSRPAGNRFGAALTYEKPIVEFGADINIGASTEIKLVAGQDLPCNCVGVRFLALVGTGRISVNGGGYRTIATGDSLQGCEIRTLTVQIDAASSVIVQAVGTGD